MERNPEVDKYIANTPEKFRDILDGVREMIFELFPEGVEVFAYQIPVYKYRGKALFSIAAFRDHYSLVTQDKNIASKIPELSNYKISGTTLHFTIDNQLTRDLLQKIIELRISERDNEQI